MKTYRASELTRRLPAVALVMACATILQAQSVEATALEFRLDGIVERIVTERSGSVLLPYYTLQGVAVGQPFSALVRYEMNPPVGYGSYDAYSQSIVRTYLATGGLTGTITFDFGNGYTIESAIDYLNVIDSSPTGPANQANYDRFEGTANPVAGNIVQSAPGGPFTTSNTQTSFQLTDFQGTAFDGAGLPGSPPDAATLERMAAQIYYTTYYSRTLPCNSVEGYCNDFATSLAYIYLLPTSISAVVVPLPAAAWLFGGALGALGVARRKGMGRRADDGSRPICLGGSPH